jgi:hypothetical protein
VRRHPFVFLVVVSVLVLGGVSQPALAAGEHRPIAAPTSGSTHDALAAALASGRISAATYAFERALSLFDVDDVRARYGDVAKPRSTDATLVLRDLRAAYDGLTSAQRRVADALLARPTDGAGDPYGFGYSVREVRPVCNRRACFHWVRRTADAPAHADANDNGRPDFVDDVVTTLNTVWRTEIGRFDFRKPKSDRTSRNHGPNGKIDIYLADIGDQGYYGYCASDDPHDFGGRYRYWDASAYCVVDDDFSPSQFPGASGVAALRVTLAHEFFHAIQFAYDYFEDRWFMESTAVWMEDEVYDAVNDNLQYLPDSPISDPTRPLDDNRTQFGVYGDWIFIRFLSEYLGSHADHDIAVVRRAWELADGSRRGPDKYSLKAVAIATKQQGQPFVRAFARFGAVNDVAQAWYEEGAANGYPSPPSHGVSLAGTDTDGNSYSMNHLTDRYVRFTPDAGLGPAAELVLDLDLPDADRGSAATVVSVPAGGGVPEFTAVSLSRHGNAHVQVPFAPADVDRVDLVLTNASTRTTCWQSVRSRYSCYGHPADDGLGFEYFASVSP